MDADPQQSNAQSADEAENQPAASAGVSSGLSTGITTERLSLILAICAILVSLASFYATYLQADSARKQVKAMTLPVMQFGHGNFDEEAGKKRLTFTLSNAGMGPAILKSVSFLYRDQPYGSLVEFFESCCAEEWGEFKATLEDGAGVDRYTFLSQPLADAVIPGQTDYRFLAIDQSEGSHDFWWRLNKERWALNLDICFCSLLDECYRMKSGGALEEVGQCPSARP